MNEITTYKNFDSKLKVAAKGDLVGVQKLIQADKTILNRPSGGHNRTLLWEAVNKNRFEIVKYLIAEGANVNIPGRYRSETFVMLKPYCIAHKKKKDKLKDYLKLKGHKNDIFSIAYLGTKEEIHKAIKRDKKVVTKFQKEDKIWKATPLHFALSGQNIETAKVLCENRAAVAAHSKLLYEIACRNNRLDFVELLTKYGGIPSEVDVPSAFYHENTAIINYFIEHGLDTDRISKFGWPPIVYMTRGDKGEHPNKIKTLLKYIKNINAQTPNGVSAMHTSSKAGYLSVLKILLETGGNINIRDKKGKTPLYYSRKFKRKKVEKYLIENGAKV